MNAPVRSQIAIRQAGSEDAQIIALLGRITFSETFGQLFTDPQDLWDYLERTFEVRKIEASLQKENNVYWLAYVEDLPVGYAKLKLRSPSPILKSKKTCQLQKIYVLRDYLEMKIGFQLQNVLLKRAVEYRCRQIWLSVLQENERAIKFYKRNGFEPIGDHDFQIGKEEFQFLAMAKSLS